MIGLVVRKQVKMWVDCMTKAVQVGARSILEKNNLGIYVHRKTNIIFLYVGCFIHGHITR